jgi:hypothetical protein
MDTDLVPGTSGVEYDTEFIFNTCVGPASGGLSSRLSDVILIGYSDSTSVTIEELDSSGTWTTSDTLTIDGGEITEWVTDMASNTVLRITSDQEMHVQLSHSSSEYAWSIYSDHIGD